MIDQPAQQTEDTEAIDHWQELMKKTLMEMDDVYAGRKSAVAQIVEETCLDERQVIDILRRMSLMNFPDVIDDYLRKHGASDNQLGIIHIGVKRVASALILQHIGLLTQQGPVTEKTE